MLFEVASNYIDTPFVHQGRVPGSGLDCVGVYVCAAHAVGLKLHDFIAYGKEASSKELLARLKENFVLVEPKEKQKDDLLLFWVITKNIPQHIGLYGGNGSFIHAYSRPQYGKVRLDSLEGRWEKHLHSVWRLAV